MLDWCTFGVWGTYPIPKLLFSEFVFARALLEEI
jgi:hypothetical protein